MLCSACVTGGIPLFLKWIDMPYSATFVVPSDHIPDGVSRRLAGNSSLYRTYRKLSRVVHSLLLFGIKTVDILLQRRKFNIDISLYAVYDAFSGAINGNGAGTGFILVESLQADFFPIHSVICLLRDQCAEPILYAFFIEASLFHAWNHQRVPVAKILLLHLRHHQIVIHIVLPRCFGGAIFIIDHKVDGFPGIKDQTEVSQCRLIVLEKCFSLVTLRESFDDGIYFTEIIFYGHGHFQTREKDRHAGGSEPAISQLIVQRSVILVCCRDSAGALCIHELPVSKQVIQRPRYVMIVVSVDVVIILLIHVFFRNFRIDNAEQRRNVSQIEQFTAAVLNGVVVGFQFVIEMQAVLFYVARLGSDDVGQCRERIDKLGIHHLFRVDNRQRAFLRGTVSGFFFIEIVKIIYDDFAQFIGSVRCIIFLIICRIPQFIQPAFVLFAVLVCTRSIILSIARLRLGRCDIVVGVIRHDECQFHTVHQAGVEIDEIKFILPAVTISIIIRNRVI